MALTKIRLANKKAKREQQRKKHNIELVKAKRVLNIRNRRMREMIITGRREELKQQRQSQIKYVKDLEGELAQ